MRKKIDVISVGALCSELLIFLDWDILPHFLKLEAVLLLGVYIKTRLIIIRWCGDVSLEVLGNAYVDYFVSDKEARDGTAGDDILGMKEIIFQIGNSMFSLTILIQLFPNSGRFTLRDHDCLIDYLTMIYDISLLETCWSCTCAKLYICRRRPCFHIRARWKCWQNLSLVVWVEELGWQDIWYITELDGIDYRFAVGLNIQNISQVKLRLCRGKGLSKPSLVLGQNLRWVSGTVFLGVRFLGLGMSMRCRLPTRCPCHRSLWSEY